MAFVLFVDESGQDQHESPYEVLGGILIEDSRIWPLITAVQQAEVDFFGRLRSLKHQALEQYLATDASQTSTRISLIATVATD